MRSAPVLIVRHWYAETELRLEASVTRRRSSGLRPKRRTSLETITSYSPFTSEAALLAEFDQGCGTRLVLWGSLEEEHELTRDDIRVREARRQEDACR